MRIFIIYKGKISKVLLTLAAFFDFLSGSFISYIGKDPLFPFTAYTISIIALSMDKKLWIPSFISLIFSLSGILLLSRNFIFLSLIALSVILKSISIFFKGYLILNSDIRWLAKVFEHFRKLYVAFAMPFILFLMLAAIKLELGDPIIADRLFICAYYQLIGLLVYPLIDAIRTYIYAMAEKEIKLSFHNISIFSKYLRNLFNKSALISKMIFRRSAFSKMFDISSFVCELSLIISLIIIETCYIIYFVNIVGLPISKAMIYISIFLVLLSHIKDLPKIKVHLSLYSVIILLGIIGISLIPTYVLISRFSEHLLLPGGDAAFYIWQLRYIETRKTVLVPWGPFPDYSKVYYPPFFGIFSYIIHSFLRLNYVQSIRLALIFITFNSGLLYYRFVRKFFNDRVSLYLLFFIMSNIGIQLRTIIEGSYCNALLSFLFIPLLINLLYDRNYIRGAFVLASTLGSHGFSIIVGFAILFSFLFSYMIDKSIKSVKEIFIIVLFLIIFSIPFFPLYFGYLNMYIQGTSAQFSSYSLTYYPNILSPIIFYLGLLSGLFLVLMSEKYKILGYWALFQFIFTHFSGNFTHEGRLIRELAPVFSLTISTVVVNIIFWIKNIKNKIEAKRKIGKSIVLILVSVFFISSFQSIQGIDYMLRNTYLPQVFVSPSRIKAYEWLSNNTTSFDKVLALQFSDPYVKAYVNGIPYSIVGPILSSSLSKNDREINDMLAFALLKGNLTILANFGITYVVISTPPNATGWWPPGELEFLRDVYLASAKFGKPVYVARSSASATFIYKIPHHNKG
jgi:hypothetical protein